MSQWNAYRDEARAMVILAWPIIIAQLAQMGTGVVDTIMAGRYGAMDLAAIAIGYNIWLPLFLLTLGIMLATSVLVAQDFGAGRLQNIRDTLPQALWLALLLGLIVGPACYKRGAVAESSRTGRQHPAEEPGLSASGCLGSARNRVVPGAALPHPGDWHPTTICNRQCARIYSQHPTQLCTHLWQVGLSRNGSCRLRLGHSHLNVAGRSADRWLHCP